MYRDFQSRLAMKHEIIKRKVLDNGTELAANPTDCIRIQYKKDKDGDIQSRIVSKATVESIIWPPLKDIPIRKIFCDGSGKYKITSLVDIANDEQNKNFDLFFPHGADLNVGDLIVRVFIDPDVKEPIVIVVKITELLGEFGQMMLISEKCHCVLETDTLPEKLVNVIGEMAERRLHIKF